MFDQNLFRQMIDEKYVSEKKHPAADLFIYNYTAKTQYDWIWNEVTTQCRGLILDGAGNVVAKPFPKFFSLEQLERTDFQIPLSSFEVFDKLDGSLGVLYWAGDAAHIATRGAFESEQAIVASEILRRKYADVPLERGKTYLFEIIYPGNRIVVDYGATADIFLLTVIDNATGAETLPDIGFPTVQRFDGLKDLSTLKSLEKDNCEGFVVRFEDGFRVKVKFEEYKRLHKLITQISNVSIWEHLRDGRDIGELMDRVPDEFLEWVKPQIKGFINEHRSVEWECEEAFKVLGTRKETALYFQTQKYPSVLFAMLDNKDYSPIIWKLIKPEWEPPFKCDEV